jgi:hypothetical protein
MKTLTAKAKPDTFIPKINYIPMLVGLSLIIIGFILMCGGKTENPEQFNNDIFNFQRITLAPCIVVLGYILQFFAIMYKKETK